MVRAETGSPVPRAKGTTFMLLFLFIFQSSTTWRCWRGTVARLFRICSVKTKSLPKSLWRVSKTTTLRIESYNFYKEKFEFVRERWNFLLFWRGQVSISKNNIRNETCFGFWLSCLPTRTIASYEIFYWCVPLFVACWFGNMSFMDAFW